MGRGGAEVACGGFAVAVDGAMLGWTGSVTGALSLRAMSSSMTSMGEMYAVLFRSEKARTWAQTRLVALSITQAPESPPAVGRSVS